MSDDNVHTFLTQYFPFRLHHGVLLGIVAQDLAREQRVNIYSQVMSQADTDLEGYVELVRIVNSDESLVSGLVLVVEI